MIVNSVVPRVVLDITVKIYLLCPLVELIGPPTSLEDFSENFWNFLYPDLFKMHSLGWSKMFNKPCSKKFEFNIWAPIPIQRCKNTSES